MKTSLIILTTFLSFMVNTASACDNTKHSKLIYLKGVASELERSSNTERKLNVKRALEKGTNKKVVKLLRDFRALNKKLIKTDKRDSKIAKKYLVGYSKLENRADKFAIVAGTSEGIGACMSECADYFPGTGGGNGINRAACKIGCLVHGG